MICILYISVYFIINVCKSEIYLILRKPNTGSFDQCAQWFLPHAELRAEPGRFPFTQNAPFWRAFINLIFCFQYSFYSQIHKSQTRIFQSVFFQTFIFTACRTSSQCGFLFTLLKGLHFKIKIWFLPSLFIFLIFSLSQPDNPVPFWKFINSI